MQILSPRPIRRILLSAVPGKSWRKRWKTREKYTKVASVPDNKRKSFPIKTNTFDQSFLGAVENS